jgi:hypothetical protein
MSSSTGFIKKAVADVVAATIIIKNMAQKSFSLLSLIIAINFLWRSLS